MLSIVMLELKNLNTANRWKALSHLSEKTAIVEHISDVTDDTDNKKVGEGLQ